MPQQIQLSHAVRQRPASPPCGQRQAGLPTRKHAAVTEVHYPTSCSEKYLPCGQRHTKPLTRVHTGAELIQSSYPNLPCGQRHTKPLKVSTQALSGWLPAPVPRQHVSVPDAQSSVLRLPLRQMGGSLRGRRAGTATHLSMGTTAACQSAVHNECNSPAPQHTKAAHLPSAKPAQMARRTAAAASEPRYWSVLITTCACVVVSDRTELELTRG